MIAPVTAAAESTGLAPLAGGLAPAAAALQSCTAEAAALLKALSNPDRLLLLCQLIDGERTVAALGDRSGISQPSLSQQLAVLRTEGLVATRRDGKHVHYRVASPAARAILTTLHEIYCIAPNANASDP